MLHDCRMVVGAAADLCPDVRGEAFHVSRVLHFAVAQEAHDGGVVLREILVVGVPAD